MILDPRETVRAIVADLDGGADAARVGARFHAALARAAAEACALVAARRGMEVAVLSGGVFQNRILVERTAALLADSGAARADPRAPAAQRRRDLLRAGRGGGRDGGGGVSVDLDELLATPVYAGGRERPFAELTAEAVADRAAELRGAVGLGHRSRVSGVAAAWDGLAAAMREAGAATVADLDRETLAERADALWVVPPGGSLLP